MKPFNLERALRGDAVITRQGKKVIELHLMKSPNLYPLVAYIEDTSSIFTYSKTGRYDNNNPCHFHDLFMDDKDYYINIYKNNKGEFYPGNTLFSNKLNACNFANEFPNFHQTIQLKISEE